MRPLLRFKTAKNLERLNLLRNGRETDKLMNTNSKPKKTRRNILMPSALILSYQKLGLLTFSHGGFSPLLFSERLLRDPSSMRRTEKKARKAEQQ